MTGSVVVACAQMRSGIDRRKNTHAAIELIREAAGRGADFVVTPEMTTLLDRDSKRLFAALPDGEAEDDIAAFSDAAKRSEVWVLVGSMPVKLEERRAANRSFLIAPDGKIVARYDKIHMFDVDLSTGEAWRESRIYKPGERAVVADATFGGIGLTICYDVRFPHLYRALAKAGAQIFTVPAAFTKPTGKAHWKALLKARAIENGAFVVAPGQGGLHEDGRETFGHSLIVGPWGEILAEADGEEPGVVLATLDLAESRKARRQIPNLGLEQAFEVTKVET